MDGNGPPNRSHTDDLASIAGKPIHAFPSGDRSFRRAVIVAISDLDGDRPLEVDGLEERLRRRYPGVRVVEQTPFGSVGGEASIYVFRDGSIAPQAGDGPGTMRYISPTVAVQRACVRNLIARGRSRALVVEAAAALDRSRARRATRAA